MTYYFPLNSELLPELQSPTGYTGIYETWNRDLDGGGPDDPWDFGLGTDYPALKGARDGVRSWQVFGLQGRTVRSMPDDFSFTPSRAVAGATAVSDVISITGINVSVPLSVAVTPSDATFTCTVDGATDCAGGLDAVSAGQRVQLRAVAGATDGDTVTITVTAGEGGNAASADWTLTTDAAATSVISIERAAAAIVEGGSAGFTLTVHPAPPADLTVNLELAVTDILIDYVTTDANGVETRHDTPVQGSRTGARVNTVTTTVQATIPAAAFTAAYTAPATTNDNLDEPDGSLVVTLQDSAAYTVAAAPGNTASVAVNDNDNVFGSATGENGVRLEFDAAPLSVVEGAMTPLTFTVTADALTTLPYTCWTAGGALSTATQPDDYTFMRDASVRFLDTTTYSLVVPVQEDDVDEPNETLEVRCSRADGAGGSISKTATIYDDDGPTAVYIETDSAATVVEGTAVTFRLRAYPAPAAALTVDLEVAVTDNGDPEATTTVPVTIPADSTTATHSVTIPADELDEPNGRIVATVVDGDGYVPGTPASLTVAVNDDDRGAGLNGINLTVSSPTAAEGAPGTTTTLTYVVAANGLTTAQYQCVTVTAGTTATPGVDYAHRHDRALGFRASMNYDFVVTVNGDDAVEVDEVIVVQCRLDSAPPGGPSGTGTITDDDAPPAPPAPTINRGEGTTANSLSITWTASDGSAVPISGYDLRYRQVGDDENAAWTDGPQDQTGTTATLTALSSNTLYEAQVRATNARGDSEWSASAFGGTHTSGAGICDRTPEVIAAIIRDLATVPGCADVNDSDMLDYVGSLNVTYSGGGTSGLTALKTFDFAGLHLLTSLTLTGHASLTTLPRGVFGDLPSVVTLNLGNNGLTTLRADAFAGLTLLRTLTLSENPLTSLPGGLLNGLSLTSLHMENTGLIAFPDGFFAGQTGLTNLDLTRANPAPPTVDLTLVLVEEGVFKVRAHSGAPQELTLTVGVSGGTSGTFDGGGTSLGVTIPAGALESDPIAVTRASAGEVLVGIAVAPLSRVRAPGIPRVGGHAGYGFTVPDAPLEVYARTVPVVTITAVNAAVTEGADAEFTLTANPAPGELMQVHVDVATTDDGNPTDTARQTFSIAQGVTTRTFSLPTTADGLDEPNGSIVATLAVQTSYEIGAASEATVTVNDDDGGAGLQGAILTFDSPEVAEGAPGETARLAFVVTASLLTTREYQCWTGSGPAPAATAGADYVPTRERGIGFRDSLTREFVVDVIGDGNDEPHEIVRVQCQRDDGVGGAPGGLGTILDDDGLPAVRIAVTNSSVTEGQPAVFTLTVYPEKLSSLNVDLEITVEDNGDPAVTETVTLFIPPGGFITHSVATVDDALDEPNGTIVVTARANSRTGGSNTATVAVLDNDLGGGVNGAGLDINNVSVVEGAPGETAQLAFEVTASGLTTAYYQCQTGSAVSTAEAGVDYVPRHDRGFQFKESVTYHFPVTVNGDSVPEPDELVGITCRLNDGTGGAAARPGTILDDDGAPAAPVVTAESGTSLLAAWSPPAGLRAPVVSYDLQYRQGSTGAFTQGPEDVAGLSAAISGLTANTAYEVQVRATSAGGDSSWSASGTGTTLAAAGGICGRTPQVRDAILATSAVPDGTACADVTGAQLAAITGIFDLNGTGPHADRLASLQAGDFAGMSGVDDLLLRENRLTTLPVGVFAGLTALDDLDLRSNALTTLPDGVFAGLSRVGQLDLSNNALTTLSDGTFAGLTQLSTLILSSNRLTTLSDGTFAGLTALVNLYLQGNALTTLPDGVFAGPTALDRLDLARNPLTALPPRVFDGLSLDGLLDLGNIRLSGFGDDLFTGLVALDRFTVSLEEGHDATPLMVGVSLVSDAEGSFKAVAPTGAPFALVLPVSVTGGSIDGGATTVTIPIGATESETLAATRGNTNEAVTASIGTLPALPGLPPPGHTGYTLAKSDTPIEVYGVPVVTIEADTSPVTEGADAVFTVTVDPASTTSFEVTLEVAVTDDDNPATTSPVTLSFAANQATATHTVPTTDDGLDENNGSVVATVQANAAYAIEGSGSAAVVVRDNDLGPGRQGTRRTISSPTVDEGADGDTTTLTFVVTASSPSTQPYRCWTPGETGRGAAQLNADYLPGEVDALVFRDAGSLTHNFAVTVKGDAEFEPDESVLVRCRSNDEDGAFGRGTILNDDDAPAPGQVTGLVVTPAGESLSLAWMPVTGADGYKVQWKSGSESYDDARQADVTAPPPPRTSSPAWRWARRTRCGWRRPSPARLTASGPTR